MCKDTFFSTRRGDRRGSGGDIAPPWSTALDKSSSGELRYQKSWTERKKRRGDSSLPPSSSEVTKVYEETDTTAASLRRSGTSELRTPRHSSRTKANQLPFGYRATPDEMHPYPEDAARASLHGRCGHPALLDHGGPFSRGSGHSCCIQSPGGACSVSAQESSRGVPAIAPRHRRALHACASTQQAAPLASSSTWIARPCARKSHLLSLSV